MKLLYISGYQFRKDSNVTYTLPAYGDSFWHKYLAVFDNIKVLGIEVKEYLKSGANTRITDSRVSVEIIPSNVHPKDFINDCKIKKILQKEISQAEAVLIKPASRKGIMAIRIAERLNKPYMIELTGDLKLTLSKHPSILRRLYGPILHKQIIRAIKNCQFGLYVTEKHLQSVYPIKGEMCGITDSVIDNIDNKILELRLQKINNLCDFSPINIGLIGSYHGTRKGIDTAIKALAKLNDERICFNILYSGSKADRELWFDYAKKNNLKCQLSFPEPRYTTQSVLEWIDTQDLIILPSRSEGLPRCIVESMSRGCPCITSNVCGLLELINNKWIHDPEDVDMLYQLLSAMIYNKQNMIESASENFNNSKRFLRATLTQKRDDFLLRFKDYCATLK